MKLDNFKKQILIEAIEDKIKDLEAFVSVLERDIVAEENEEFWLELLADRTMYIDKINNYKELLNEVKGGE